MWVRAPGTAAAVAVALVGALLVPAAGTTAGTTDPSLRQAMPRLKIANASITEADTGATTVLRFRVGLSSKPRRPVRVSYRTLAGTAVPVSDFVAERGTVRLTRMRPSRVITVAVVGDAAAEPVERMFVEITRVRGPARLVDALGVGRITDTDPALLTVEKTGSPGGYGVIYVEPGGLACGTTCTYEFPPGTAVTLTADPNNTETEFASWQGDCAAAGTNLLCQLVMDRDRQATAVFTGE